MHIGSLLSPITPMYFWRKGLITRIPKLQEFVWTHNGEGILCAQSQLCLQLPTPTSLFTEMC